MIKIENVNKEIKGKLVLKDINLQLEKCQIVLLKGHNGCGKTMLLRLIAGFIKPTEGDIDIPENLEYGVIIENPSFFLNETAMYNMQYLAKIKNKINNSDIDKYLDLFGLFDKKNNKVKSYSLGMKQRLGLCQAFMENPDIILLDEPFNAIDDENKEKVYKIVEKEKEKGKLVIIASHGDVSGLNFDKVITMSDGKIISIE